MDLFVEYSCLFSTMYCLSCMAFVRTFLMLANACLNVTNIPNTNTVVHVLKFVFKIQASSLSSND